MTKSYRIHINGVVQGVGFRPFIYRLAGRHGLVGWVRNSSQGVEIVAEGEPEALRPFVQAIQSEMPPQAVIDELSVEEAEAHGYIGFRIEESSDGIGSTRISPDIATCSDCLREIGDPGDRRQRYPFTNCTNCGPRFSIIERLPYDRPGTSMAEFLMCPRCLQEYQDPQDRRFHAQPNACPECGPHAWLADRAGGRVAEGEMAVSKTAELLDKRAIVAIKGLGGFHLACRADDDAALEKLRGRKQRPHKPLAVMAGSVQDAAAVCHVSELEAEVLASPAAPIVLLRKRDPWLLSQQLSPDNTCLGVMLPSAPLQHLVFRALPWPADRPRCLVMTSGNLQDEPVAAGNEQALEKLDGLADFFLMHDRDILNRCDDSLVFAVDGLPKPEPPSIQIIRHARGYAPNPIRLPVKVRPTLAVGGEMKNVFCLASGDRAFASQHIGEMDSLETMAFFQEMADRYRQWFRIDPEVIAHDLHPDYLTTRWALEQQAAKRVPVQHHAAHILSVLADRAAMRPAIGVAFDGTGYGLDGKSWGGEFLVFDGQRDVRRAGHLEYLPLPGGEASIKKPVRIAAAYSWHLLGGTGKQFKGLVSDEELGIIGRQLEQGMNLAWTSSVGRLFDAASALLGICPAITFEAQAAMALESRADGGVAGTYPYDITKDEAGYRIKLKRLWQGLAEDVERGAGPATCAAKFQNTIIDFTISMCDNLKMHYGIDTVALSGGVFQNRRLLEGTMRGLSQKGYQVLCHRQVPANDGGIALGQILASALEA